MVLAGMRHLGSMLMAMMDIRVMRVFVRDARVPMKMAVRLLAAPLKIMFMLVVCIVNVAMRMFQRFMRMFMGVVFGQVQPDAQAHQAGCEPEGSRCGFVQQQYGNRRADEGRSGEIGAGAC